MNERIKKLRKALDLTQQEFSDRIGCSRNLVANYEIGNRNPSSSVINNICKTFNVNEQWLRTGEGEMLLAKPTAVLDALAVEYSLSDRDYTMIEKFLTLKPESRKIIIDYMMEVSATIVSMEAEGALPVAPPPVTISKTETTTPQPDAAAELKRSDQELSGWDQEADEFAAKAAAIARKQFLEEKRRAAQASSAKESDTA